MDLDRFLDFDLLDLDRFRALDLDLDRFLVRDFLDLDRFREVDLDLDRFLDLELLCLTFEAEAAVANAFFIPAQKPPTQKFFKLEVL